MKKNEEYELYVITKIPGNDTFLKFTIDNTGFFNTLRKEKESNLDYWIDSDITTPFTDDYLVTDLNLSYDGKIGSVTMEPTTEVKARESL